MKYTPVLIAGLSLAGLAGLNADAAPILFTLTDGTPNGATTPTTTLGSVDNPASIPTTTYTVSGLDLTSVGGGASETIVIDVTYSSNVGSPVFNGFGNVAVDGPGGDDPDQIEVGESLTAVVSLNSTTYTGDIGLGFISVRAGGVNPSETWNVTHDGGTINATSDNTTSTFASSSFVTIATTSSPYNPDELNLQQFIVEVTAVPEPGSLALLGLGGLCMLRRRRA